MNRELLPPEEYYRSRRAAELRRQAERLERWWAGPVGYTLELLGAALWIAVLLLLPVLQGGVLVCIAAAAMLAAWVERLPRCAVRYRDEAAILEREHQARCAAFPPGQAP